MDLEGYSFLADGEYVTYEFISEGPRGSITKIVSFKEIEHNIYNVGFGDWDPKDKTVDDKVRSNNSDRDKVLATVASIIIEFVKHHQDVIIWMQRNTPSRTRLYQIGIVKNWEVINRVFDIFGFVEGKWEPFIKGKHYEEFALHDK